jgi:benzaldehyde dehydrogenase (NAD)
MSILDTATWNARLYSSGWRIGSGRPSPVIEPATGIRLGQLGLADESDVAAAGAAASVAQREWAARPYEERAAVLRRAGTLCQDHATDVHE